MLDTGNIQKLDRVKGDKANQERHELTRVSGIGKNQRIMIIPDPDPQHWAPKVDEMLDTGNIQKLDKVKGDKANQERHELTRVSGIGIWNDVFRIRFCFFWSFLIRMRILL